MGAYASVAVLLLCGFSFLGTEVSWAYLAALAVFEIWLMRRVASVGNGPVAVDQPPYRFSAEEAGLVTRYRFYFTYPNAAREATSVLAALGLTALVLVSHDRHLLRATTDQLLIVRDGSVRAFDGDLEDYRESLLKTKIEVYKEKIFVKKQSPSKNLQTRIKRLEDTMARLHAQKSDIEAKLADAAVYRDPAALKALLLDQAYVGKELAQLEGEWLLKQAELESGA